MYVFFFFSCGHLNKQTDDVFNKAERQKFNGKPINKKKLFSSLTFLLMFGSALTNLLESEDGNSSAYY